MTELAGVDMHVNPLKFSHILILFTFWYKGDNFLISCFLLCYWFITIHGVLKISGITTTEKKAITKLTDIKIRSVLVISLITHKRLGTTKPSMFSIYNRGSLGEESTGVFI